jgi:hypothetical protein
MARDLAADALVNARPFSIVEHGIPTAGSATAKARVATRWRAW